MGIFYRHNGVSDYCKPILCVSSSEQRSLVYSRESRDTLPALKSGKKSHNYWIQMLTLTQRWSRAFQWQAPCLAVEWKFTRYMTISLMIRPKIFRDRKVRSFNMKKSEHLTIYELDSATTIDIHAASLRRCNCPQAEKSLNVRGCAQIFRLAPHTK